MQSKKFKDDFIYFKDLVEYVGPITLMYRPQLTIFMCMNKYLVELSNKYYEIISVIYKNEEYSMADFVNKYPEVLEF